jgi:hypothetical protein
MGKAESLGDEIKEKLGEIVKVVAPGLYYGAEAAEKAAEKAAAAHPDGTKKLEEAAKAVAPGAVYAVEAVEHASTPSTATAPKTPSTPGKSK